MIWTLIGWSSVLFFLALTVFLGVIALKKWAFPVAHAALEAWWSERWGEINERLRNVEEDLVALPRTWEEFARDAKKAQERARWHVRRVKKELEARGFEDAEIDTLDGELFRTDGEGGNGQRLLPLHDAVETVPPAPENWRTRALNQKWGSR